MMCDKVPNLRINWGGVHLSMGCRSVRAVGDLRPGSRETVGGELPRGLPNRFPLYSEPEVIRKIPLVPRYITEAASEDLLSEMAALYSEELSGGRPGGCIAKPFGALEDDERTTVGGRQREASGEPVAVDIAVVGGDHREDS